MKNQRKARWIQKTHLFRADEYVCSACGHTGRQPAPVCPNCNCSMKNGKYDPTWVDEIEMFDAFFGD